MRLHILTSAFTSAFTFAFARMARVTLSIKILKMVQRHFASFKWQKFTFTFTFTILQAFPLYKAYMFRFGQFVKALNKNINT